ncbi:MAG: imidazole glycerol phosphate synthase subunit HisH [Dysgonamonadaceae bacterium]|jgi:glutamine amidotransferase|nr:imidazole glycerol phosphate synthase subunit HisH [Dysgonamonadaceae bacterium]
MQVAIINYNAGNIYSVDYALRRIGISPVITADKQTIRQADKVIFPGQGEANTTMRFLREQALDKLIIDLKQPVLGICIGMQLLCKHSEEGDTDCLGIFDTDVRRFHPQQWEDKVPHMGWNEIYNLQSPLYAGIAAGEFVYFVHSYYVPLCKETIATADYIQAFSASLHKDNFYATQFHPEKSGSIGERILQNFIAL